MNRKNFVSGKIYIEGSSEHRLFCLADYFTIYYHHRKLGQRNDSDCTYKLCTRRKSACNNRHFDGIIAEKPSTDTPTVRSYRPASMLLHFRYRQPFCTVTSTFVPEGASDSARMSYDFLQPCLQIATRSMITCSATISEFYRSAGQLN